MHPIFLFFPDLLSEYLRIRVLTWFLVRPQGQTEGRVLREMPGLGRAPVAHEAPSVRGAAEIRVPRDDPPSSVSLGGRRLAMFGTAPWRATRSHLKRQTEGDHPTSQVFSRRGSTQLSQSQVGMRRRRHKLAETRRQVCLSFELGSAVSCFPAPRFRFKNLVGLAVVVYIYKPKGRRCMLWPRSWTDKDLPTGSGQIIVDACAGRASCCTASSVSHRRELP